MTEEPVTRDKFTLTWDTWQNNLFILFCFLFVSFKFSLKVHLAFIPVGFEAQLKMKKLHLVPFCTCGAT